MLFFIVSEAAAVMVAVRGAAEAPGGEGVLWTPRLATARSPVWIAACVRLTPWTMGATVVCAPRPRVFTGARNEFVLTAESLVNPLIRGLPALDQALGRGAAAPAFGCRLTRVALAVGASLLRRS